MKELSKLEEVALREIWENEARDFTPWLAEDDNIKYIGEILGLDIVDVKTEQQVGSYHCDILAKDETTNDVIIIENQLETTNHDHLGKLITYASGYDAKYMVWIVKEAKEEHRSAIEWLNNNSISGINYFLIEVHAFKIGNSKPAPQFVVIEQPNDFSKRTKTSAEELNTSEQERLLFWEQFENYIKENKINDLGFRKPTTNHWRNVAVGTTKCYISITLIGEEKHIGVEIYINDNKEFFDELENYKEDIEKNTGLNFEWKRLNEKKASRIKSKIEGLDFNNHSNYEELIKEIIDRVKKIKEEVQKYIKLENDKM